MSELIDDNNECEILGDARIDNCDIALELAETDWAKGYWATVRAVLVRKMQYVTPI
jgi:hypothetical protein